MERIPLLALMVIGFLPAARAGSIDAIYAFGDSLSDVGNIYTATSGAIPGPPYVNGQFSNGQVWVQGLAAALGLAPLAPSLLGGTNYAYGDAETGPTAFNTSVPQTDLTGPTGQLAQFGAAHSTADPNALYTIWIGSNDLIDILKGAAPSQYAADIGAAVSNVNTAIGTLAAGGAKNFLILTVPDLGKTPQAIAGGPAVQAAASALAVNFNNALVSGAVTAASSDSLNLSILNTYSLLDGIIANPSIYGFTNVTDPCLTGSTNYAGGTACAATTAAQNQYLFWDLTHPTAAGHAIIADAAATAETPEPGSLSLIAAGLVAIGLVFRLRRAHRADMGSPK